MPQISVVIPSYNCGPYIAEALDSVLGQTYSDLEIIVVNDGSTDNTGEIIKPYRDTIIYIEQQNRGLPAARNVGIRAASGDYIALLDADDSWIPNKLDQQMPRFSDLEVGIVCSDVSVTYSDGRFLPSFLAERPLATEGYIIDNYIQSRFLFPSTMIFRRQCFDQVGLFDEEMFACEDMELFMKMCLRWKVALVREQLVIRREGGYNITANHEKLGRYTILAFRKFLAAEPELKPSTKKIVKEELGRQCWYRAYTAYSTSNLPEARKCLIDSMRFDAANIRRCMPLLIASWFPASIRERLKQWRRAMISP